MSSKVIAGRFVAVVAALAAVACSHGSNGSNRSHSDGTINADSSMTVDLEYKDLVTGIRPPMATSQCNSYSFAVTNGSPRKDEFGANLQNATPRAVKARDGEVQAFFQQGLNKELPRFGFALAAVGAQAKRVLAVNLTSVMVEEANTYSAGVNAEVQVRDASGKVLAQKAFQGIGKKWGRSFNGPEYVHALANAFVDLLNNIFADAEFMKVLASPC
jgi:hypothetical protein